MTDHPPLYDPREHEPLTEQRWDESRARAAIQRIVTDAEEHFDPVRYWPLHPRDDEGLEPEVEMSLFIGAAGVVWALDYLEREGAASVWRTYDADAILRRYLASPDYGQTVPAYLTGQSGILLLMYKLDPCRETARQLEEQIRANVDNPANELMWGAPGTMLAALTMFDWTGEERWSELYLAGAEHLWEEWHEDEELGWLWTQHLSGKTSRMLGTVHGFAGNVGALLAGPHPPERWDALLRRAGQTLAQTAQVDGDVVNWPPTADSGTGTNRVQWCHGAPGLVCALARSVPDGSVALDLLQGGGELTWQAGPLAKGPGLCHGTAGNGYAFLKLHARTGRALWLRRARAFAMHAIDQCEDARRVHGRGRYTLWTGDLGVAVYLWHCINAQALVPTIDVF